MILLSLSGRRARLAYGTPGSVHSGHGLRCGMGLSRWRHSRNVRCLMEIDSQGNNHPQRIGGEARTK